MAREAILDILREVTRTIVGGKLGLDVVVISTIPTPPSITSVTPGNLKNTITWTAVAGATDYVVYFSTSPGVTTASSEIITGSTATTYEHTGLTNGTTYYYRVLAVGAWGNTPLSNEDSDTPQAYTNVKSTLLDGIDEFVTFGNNHNYENNVAFTFSAWVKVTNILGTHKNIWSKASNDVNVFGWSVNILSPAGTVQTTMRASGQLRAITSSGTPFATSGVWVHVVLTSTGNQNISGVRLYFDGVIDAATSSGTVTNTLIVTEASMIGIRSTTFPLNGNVDEVTFWGVAMDATEVAELYNSGSPDDPNNHSQAANLQHWYKCGDDDTFPTWTDNKGAVNGTMTNAESSDFVSDVP